MGLGLIITYSARAYCQLKPADVEDLAEEAMAGVSGMGVSASVTSRQALLCKIPSFGVLLGHPVGFNVRCCHLELGRQLTRVRSVDVTKRVLRPRLN